MIKKSSILALTLAACIASGCETKTGTGALAGGALGAGIGGIAGGGKGALIGGAAGVIAGGLIGAALDNHDQENLQKRNPQTLNRLHSGEQLTVADIIALKQSNISDVKIIDLINHTHSSFDLSTNDIKQLQNAGVSDDVINHMMKQE